MPRKIKPVDWKRMSSALVSAIRGARACEVCALTESQRGHFENILEKFEGAEVRHREYLRRARRAKEGREI